MSIEPSGAIKRLQIAGWGAVSLAVLGLVGSAVALVLHGITPGDFASLLVALATTVLAGITMLVLADDRGEIQLLNRQAAAAENQAAASLASAEASRALVESSAVDRELGLQPFLAFLGFPQMYSDKSLAQPVGVANVGKGPALKCRIIAVGEDRAWWRLDTVLGAGQTEQRLELPAQRGPSPSWVPPAATGIPNLMMYCFDQFGNRFRFDGTGNPPEIFRPSRGEVAPWEEVWNL